MMTRVRAAFLLGFLATSGCICQAAVRLPPVLGSHMVLQRQMAVSIWGTAAPNEAVTVTFRTQVKKTTADADGQWLVKLDPLQAGGPDDLTVTGANTITLTDVLVGEVWVGSGQSNMWLYFDIALTTDASLQQILDAAPYPRVRLFSTVNNWQEATAAHCKAFSTQMLAFGLTLQQQLDVPVGLMVGAMGSTASGFWLTDEMYRSDAACQTVLENYLKEHPYDAAKADAAYQPVLQQYTAAKADWDKLTAAEKKGKRAPQKPNPPVKPGDFDREIGFFYTLYIQPMIPFAIRGVLWDQGESGTGITGVDQYTLMGALIRGWRKAWGQGDFPFLYVQKPSGFGCAYDPNDPVTKQAEPFAPLPAKVPDDGGYRETHVRLMSYPNTAMVISSDLGSGTHPVNKRGYSERDARVALGFVYGRNIEYYGPIFQSQTVEGGKIRIRFTHTGQGLAIRAGQEKLQGFAVAGEDKQFVWADAVIEGQTVVVSNAKVARPLYVRYAWAESIPWADLFNKDGLPAVSFRTDK